MTFQLLSPSTYEFTLLVYIHFLFQIMWSVQFLFYDQFLDSPEYCWWQCADDVGRNEMLITEMLIKGLNMYINLNFICNNEMRPFTLMSLHFNHMEMKTMNSIKSVFEPFSSEYCWGNCLDQCHAGSTKAAIGKFIQSHRNQDKISWWLSDCNGEKYELGGYELIQF